MLVALLLVALSGTLIVLASLRPRDATPIDRAAYDQLMATRMQGLDDLLDWFYGQQDQWVRIIPPGLEELIQPGLPEVVVLNPDGKAWPESLQKALSGLKPTWRNSVPTYELDLHESLNGEITISDTGGNILYTVPTPGDYQVPYEALFRQSVNPLLYEPWLNRYKLRARITLLPQAYVEPYLYAQAEQEAYAQQQAVPETPMMLMSGGSEELAISGMELLTNGFRLTVSYPASFSGQVWSVYQQNTPALDANLTNSFNGLESAWSLVFNNLVLTGETATSWTDLQPMGSDTNGNPMHRFYGVGSNEDPDNDELQSGYELFIAHTDEQNADSDGDSLLDGWEIAYGLNAADATGNNGAAGDPDADGLSNAEEQGLGSNPTEANSITVLSPAQVTVQYRSILATREKCGWQEFTQSNEPPVIYRRITQVASETDQYSGLETICSTSGVDNYTANYQATTYTNCNPDTGVQSNVYVSGYLSSAYAITHPPCPIWWRNDNLHLLASGSWTGTITGFGPPYPSAYCSDPSGCSTGVTYEYSQRFEIANGTETITTTQWSRTEEVAHEAPDQGMRVRNMTYTLSELYTTEDLAARARAAVTNCAGWDDITWGNSRWVVGTNCVAQTGTEGNAWYDLTEDERTAKARALQYKISFSTVADQVYEVSWVEVFEGATTNVLLNRRVRKMGTGGVIELPVETIDPPAEEGVVYPVVTKISIIQPYSLWWAPTSMPSGYHGADVAEARVEPTSWAGQGTFKWEVLGSKGYGALGLIPVGGGSAQNVTKIDYEYVNIFTKGYSDVLGDVTLRLTYTPPGASSPACIVTKTLTVRTFKLVLGGFDHDPNGSGWTTYRDMFVKDQLGGDIPLGIDANEFFTDWQSLWSGETWGAPTQQGSSSGWTWWTDMVTEPGPCNCTPEPVNPTVTGAATPVDRAIQTWRYGSTVQGSGDVFINGAINFQRNLGFADHAQ